MFYLLCFFWVSLFPIEKKAAVIDLNQYYALVHHNDDTLYVVNFWATWCKPCVNEMPFFTAADSAYKKQKIKVLFISLNSAREVAKVNSFIAEKQLQQHVCLLSAGNPNYWIDKIDSTWSGSIPVTVLYKGGKKIFFHEGEFTREELFTIIEDKIKR